EFVGGAGDGRVLEQWCRERLVPYKVPVSFRPVDALPRNESGKVARRQLLAVAPDTSAADVVEAVRSWIDDNVPVAWRDAAERGSAAAIREVRARAEDQESYPAFARSGPVAPAWPVEYGGLDLPPEVARTVEAELRPYNLGRLNPLGLNLAAPALFAHGTEEQRRRFLPPIVRNAERWCQLFSEPGAGSDLASL